MGLILDTNVLIRAERASGTVDFDAGVEDGEAFIRSAISASELLVGVHMADSPAHRMKRAAFVEGILQPIPVLDFDPATARVHAEPLAALPSGITIGAHDLIIGATDFPDRQHGRFRTHARRQGLGVGVTPLMRGQGPALSRGAPLNCTFILASPLPPWGGTHEDSVGLYRETEGGECPIVPSRQEAPRCGTSSRPWFTP